MFGIEDFFFEFSFLNLKTQQYTLVALAPQWKQAMK